MSTRRPAAGSPTVSAARTAVSRRRFLSQSLGGLGVGAALGALGAGSLRAQTGDVDDPAVVLEQIEILLAEFERSVLAPGAASFLGIPLVNERLLAPEVLFDEVLRALLDQMTARAFSLDWAAPAFSPDYRHLREDRRLTPFALTPAAMEAAAARNHFPLIGDVVIFGARGAQFWRKPAAGFTEPSTDGVIAREATPNHRDHRCLLGVWRRDAGTVQAFEASTVPSAPMVVAQQQLRNAGDVASLLPTGLHTVAVGPHRAATRRPQWGALRQISPSAVLRSYGRSDGAAAYTLYEKWDLESETVGANIHASSFDETPFRDRVFFSSAGGPALAGDYGGAVPGAPTRGWAAFRTALGLDAAPALLPNATTREDGLQFPFMLLTGRDLRIASVAPEDRPEFRRLRLGSVSDAIPAIQASLGAPSTGVFDLATQRAFLRWQLLREGGGDGIVTPGLARSGFGVTL